MQFLQRALALISVGLAPPVGPLDARSATLGALLGSILLVIGLAAVAARTRSRLVAIATGGLVAAAAALAALFAGERGPVGRGVFVMAPIVWSALAIAGSALVGVRAPRLVRGTLRAAWAGAAVGLILTGASFARFSTRAEMWRRVATRDPGNEHAAVALAAHRPADARAVLARCVEANATACKCARELARLPSTAAEDAWTTGVVPDCRADSAVARKYLEALLARGEHDVVLRTTEAMIARDANDVDALVARATAQWRTKDAPGALHTARRAFGGPRNVDARMLVGNILLADRDFDGAANEFRVVIAADPFHAASRYNLALVADMRNRYSDAREGYLAALRIQPNLADARYNLVLLTGRFGAAAEALHHLEQLAKIAPSDPRLPQLRRALQSP